MKLTLMETPPPFLISDMTAVPTLCPCAFFISTVTGLVAAAAKPANRATEKMLRKVIGDMETGYKKPAVSSQQPGLCRAFWLLLLC
jgi:hypothetical protein